MAWLEVSLSIHRDKADAVEAALQQLEALAITLQDDADQPVLEPAPGTAPLWPVVQMRGLFPAATRRSEVMQVLLDAAGLDRPQALVWRTVADQAWERAWMDRFQPMKFGRRLWIVPSGMEAPADDQAVLLHLDPGLAFGTGTHPTTALCLRWIDNYEFSGLKVVDYGCGSGVLGIASAIKGAHRVVCVDNDPQALEATAANAARNGVLERIVCQKPEAYRERRADIVLANILARPLINLAPVLQSSVRAGGQIVLSGILEEQAQEVAQVYRKKFGDMKISAREGWVRLHGCAV
jgi:ribosomal protein L11 methyltransferase